MLPCYEATWGTRCTYVQWQSGLFILNLYLEREGEGWKINLWTFLLRKYCREIIPLQSAAHEEKQLREIFTTKGLLNLMKQEAMKSSPG